jgi:glycosyltransferase involved in cell wall biosynthesis
LRIAVILPQPYLGGTLKATREFCQLLREAGAQVVCGLIEGAYTAEQLRPYRDAGIPVRGLRWRIVSGVDAGVLAANAGLSESALADHASWLVADDGGNGLLDCRLWVIMSDRITSPLLPLRPYVTVVYDYIQRYVPEILTPEAWDVYARCYRLAALDAWRVVATTPDTLADCVHYAGVALQRARYVPMHYLAPSSIPPAAKKRDGILWLCNSTQHKNHITVIDGLERYWSTGGRCAATMAGPLTDRFNDVHAVGYFDEVRSRIKALGPYRKMLSIAGVLPEARFWQTIGSSAVVLHGARADNGTFAAIDATLCGAALVSSDYPQMRYIANHFEIDPLWFDPYDASALASRLHDAQRCPPVVDPARTYTAIGRQWHAAREAIVSLIGEAENDLPRQPPVGIHA